MKTFEFKREFFVFQKFLGAFVFLSFLLFLPKNFSKTSNSNSSFSKRDSKTLLSLARSFQADVDQTATADTSSIFTKVFAGIGRFFSLVGRGFATGISETVKFLGRVISLPITATLSLFSRTEPAADTAA